MLILNPELLAQPCGCGTERSYESCCYPLHSRQKLAQTAEELMRSRFVAFRLELKEYLTATWDPATCPDVLDFTPGMVWTKLSINGRKKGRKKDREGWVTFLATYQIGNEVGHLHEKSYFKKDDKQAWRYVDGQIKS